MPGWPKNSITIGKAAWQKANIYTAVHCRLPGDPSIARLRDISCHAPPASQEAGATEAQDEMHPKISSDVESSLAGWLDDGAVNDTR